MAETEYESQTSDNEYVYIYSVNWYSQTFTPSIAHTITKVRLKFGRYGLPGTISVSIRAATGTAGSTSKPTGNDLTDVATADSDSLPTGADDSSTIDFTFDSPIILAANTTYTIVIRALGGDVSNKLRIRYWKYGEKYADGNRASSDNSGVDWSATDDTQDCYFREYGTKYFAMPGTGPDVQYKKILVAVANSGFWYEDI